MADTVSKTAPAAPASESVVPKSIAAVVAAVTPDARPKPLASVVAAVTKAVTPGDAKPAPAKTSTATKPAVTAKPTPTSAKTIAKSAPATKPAAAALKVPSRKAKPAARKPAVKAPVSTPITTTAAPVRTAISTKDITMTDKTQAILSEMNDRTKGTMEKGAKMFEDMNAFNKGNIEAIVESSKIAARNLETIGQDAADYAKKSFEGATATMKTLASVKSPTEFMQIQSDYARSAFDTMVQEGSRSTEKLIKMMSEIAQPISNRVSIASEKMKVGA